MDFTLGKIRTQRDVVDDQMRPRPDIEWLELRKTLETKFGISDADLKKYDEIPEDAVEAACAPPRSPCRRAPPCACRRAEASEGRRGTWWGALRVSP